MVKQITSTHPTQLKQYINQISIQNGIKVPLETNLDHQIRKSVRTLTSMKIQIAQFSNQDHGQSKEEKMDQNNIWSLYKRSLEICMIQINMNLTTIASK